MRLLVDGFISRMQPGLDRFVEAEGLQLSVVEFDQNLSAPDLVLEMARRRPDVVVVGHEWLMIAPLFHKVLEMGGCLNTFPVVGSAQIDDVLKVRTAYNNFFDVVKIGVSGPEFVDSIRRVARGESLLKNDNLWTRVPRPYMVSDLTGITRDEVYVAIIELICIGLTDREIGGVIHLSTQTIRNRISAMLEKSGLGNRTQMAWIYFNQVLTTRMIENLRVHGIG